MVYKEILYGSWKKEIRQLIRRRLNMRNKIRYHKLKIDNFEKELLPEVEKKLNLYLKRAGNK